ncbi:hypothetical protein IAQ61_007297 [Plenodomus lingam]|uniref:uncharacterized protein n=1 Tax=Leptosphaeria maculans TaxID=5022 RepID=UPI0033266985|nr:hypothetical protein IAQ61_007297 [Plenodomus lingam]
MIHIDKPFARESGPWPFPNAITKVICQHAGREASAALFAALGPWANGGPAARKATYREPFTYWDWHGVRPDERFSRTRGLKGQLLWERQRGYPQKGRAGEFGYPSPRARWQAFSALIATHPERRFWVKHLAVAHWMHQEDLEWIAVQFPMLESLDLSDTLAIPVRAGTTPAATPTVSKASGLPSPQMADLLAKIKWLGIPAVRSPGSEYMQLLPLKQYLSLCTGLQSLCIRDTRDGDMRACGFESAQAVADWVGGVVADVPVRTVDVELRVCCVDVESLVAALARGKPRVTRVGVDFGAWVRGCGLIVDQEDQVFPTGSKRWLPDSSAPVEGRPDQDYQTDRPVFARNIRQDQHVQALGGGGAQSSQTQLAGLRDASNNTTTAKQSHDRSNCTSLYENLFRLYKAGTDIRHRKILFFSLTPEWQTNSTDPIHPLAMIQPESDGRSVSTGQLTSLYSWLNTTFGWRPVFDWDYFMGLDMPNEHDTLIKQIALQFQYMRNASIPIQILIGRRPLDLSSLYWGHDESTWTQTLARPFNNSLDHIAPLMDTLIIHYDLRNPLNHNLLQEIDRLEPHVEPAAFCPRSLCPWPQNHCPFEKQWADRPTAPCPQPKSFRTIHPGPDFPRSPKIPSPLANNNTPYLPTGEDANLDTTDDYDAADPHARPTLHKLARHAAYLREATGWQRFWTAYAPVLTNLSALHVRMPRAFDKVGNWQLGQLLDCRRGWKMCCFAEERQRMQMREDLALDIGGGNAGVAGLLEGKVWPGGRFVRRIWIRRRAPPCFTLPASEHASSAIPAPATGFTIFSPSHQANLTHQALQHAIHTAQSAARAQKSRQKELESRTHPPHARAAQ